ncbi:glycosyltransferase [Aestuariimicrobium ganziense]|uniref:glycosyltransferase n=1 Tax=Aestuariimicrobium ganziense TaxID=2773677 RepID=UPI001944C0AD|nr:glycosyltransferase [Aestuariimicrobium ganziense]
MTGSNAPGSPLVSVVVPCHNIRGEWLHETIASIRAQTHPAIEIIVVDDASTRPDTLEALTALEASCTVIRRDRNGGVGAAINTGVAAAKGVYFTTLGDDLIDPPYLAEAAAVLTNDPTIGMVHCRGDLFGTQSGPWNLPDFTIERQLFENCVFAPSLYRREDWVTVGGLDEQIKGLVDYDFIMKLLSLGRGVHRLDHTWFHYRRPGDSTIDWLQEDRSREVASRARIFRNSIDLYADNAEPFWEQILDMMHELRRVRGERNDLYHRYRPLERVRQSRVGARAWTRARVLRRSLRRAGQLVRR